jgi:hypothetical protein
MIIPRHGDVGLECALTPDKAWPTKTGRGIAPDSQHSSLVMVEFALQRAIRLTAQGSGQEISDARVAGTPRRRSPYCWHRLRPCFEYNSAAAPGSGPQFS